MKLSGKNEKVTTPGGKAQLKNLHGEVVLEEAISSSDLLYVKQPGTFVSKEQLEELLSVKIIDKDELSAAGNISGDDETYFYFGGIKFWYNEADDADAVRAKGLKYLVAAEELERHAKVQKDKAAELARKVAEETERLRLKALKEEGEKRREIDKLKTALSREGVSWAQEVATSLYAKGVRA